MNEITPPIVDSHTGSGRIAYRVDRLSLVGTYRMLRDKYQMSLSEASIKEIQVKIRERGEAFIVV